MAKNVEYKVLQGLDYPPAKRAEAGDVVSDLPKDAISWLLADGVIALVGKTLPEEVEPEIEHEVEVENLASIAEDDLFAEEEEVDGV